MHILQYIVYTVIALIGTLMAYPLVPVAVYFADADGRLPMWARWLETHDAVGWSGPQSEPATAKYSKRTGLVMWLWRNKAYRLRWWLRADVKPYYLRTERGVTIPARWGYSYWYGQIGQAFEFNPRIGFGKFHLHMRIGWKLKPYFTQQEWPTQLSAGMFTGISIRSDDWDDYVE